MKRSVVFFLMLSISIGVFFSLEGCTNRETAPENKCVAMYVAFGKGNYIMVNQENRNAFTINMPEKIFNISGEQITAESLQNGNILEITSDGLVMETYPEQYPGVTEIHVIDEGDPQNAKQYQDIIDTVYVEPNPSEPPYLHVERQTEMFANAILAVKGNYQWNWTEDEAAEIGGTAIACGIHILEWKNMNSIDLDGTEMLHLIFSLEPDTVQVSRWPESSLGKAMDTSNTGENVEASAKDVGGWLIQAEPGYVYSVYAKWGESYVEYGFMTQEPQ